MILIKSLQTGGRVVKPDTVIHEGLVPKVPEGYNKERQEIVDGKIRTYHSMQRNEPKENILPPSVKPVPASTPTTDPVAYDKLIKGKLASGVPVQKLVNDGLISVAQAKIYSPFEVKRDVYTEENIPKVENKLISKGVNNPENKQTILYGGVNAYRKNIAEAAGNGYQAYDLPDATGNYTNQAKRVYAIGDKIIDPTKSTWDKNNKIVPHFTGETLPSEGNVNYGKPSDDGVTKQNKGTINSFMQPGSSVNRNNFGGSGVNEQTVQGSNNTKTFVAPKYDSNGKLIGEQEVVPTKDPKQVGKMYNAPSFKKGGLMNCKCGGMLYKKKVSKKQDGGNMSSQRQY